MKIALLGYGKMGKAIERISLEMGHEILLTIDSETEWISYGHLLTEADVAIEFTTPLTAVNNVKRCIEARIPVITGTTGWDDLKAPLKKACERADATVVSASNFSVGVNLFFLINKFAANLMKPFTDYDIKIEEVHHVQKLDAPSGTAKIIASDILKIYDHKKAWVNSAVEDKQLLGVESVRKDDIKGDHIVTFFSESDEIQLKHSARSRDGFARGALLAATWAIGKKGWFTMDDVLQGMTGFTNLV